MCPFSNEEFENKYNIYPDKLGLKKKNECTCKTLFLDLQTEVRDRRFTNKLFDKRDAFPFNINKMPYTYSNSNILTKITIYLLKYLCFTYCQDNSKSDSYGNPR